MNVGKTPTSDSTSEDAETFSEVTKKRSHTTEEREMTGQRSVQSRRDTDKGEKSPDRQQNDNGGRALEFIKHLSYKLGVAHTDSDQRPATSLNNDLMLIDIGKMVMEFLMEGQQEYPQ